MTSQQTQISGYRKLNADEITRINTVKGLEKQVIDFMDIQSQIGEANPRWLAIARTDLAKAFMTLSRSIARPNGE